MNRVPRWLMGLAVLSLVVVVGCSGDPRADGPIREKRDYPRMASLPTLVMPNGNTPNKPKWKPRSELKIPEELRQSKTEEVKPRSEWEDYSRWPLNSFVEYEKGEMTVRRELVDLADHAAIEIVETREPNEIGGMKTKRLAHEILFDGPPLKPMEGTTVETKPSERKFKIGDKEIMADSVVEVRMDEKVIRKTWISSKVPLGGRVLREDDEGNVLLKLVAFGTGEEKPKEDGE